MTSITKPSLTKVSETCENPLSKDLFKDFLASKGKMKQFSKNTELVALSVLQPSFVGVRDKSAVEQLQKSQAMEPMTHNCT